MSRGELVRIVFVDDDDIGIIEFVARHQAIFAVDFEKPDRDHQSAGEREGVGLCEGVFR